MTQPCPICSGSHKFSILTVLLIQWVTFVILFILIEMSSHLNEVNKDLYYLLSPTLNVIKLTNVVMKPMTQPAVFGP